MVWVLFFQFIKTAGRLAIKIIAWLLVALSLWIPFAYTVFFVVIAGFLGASLSENATLFWAGLVASFVGSFLMSLFLHERRQKNKRDFRAQKKQRLSGGEEVVERGENHLQAGFRCPYSQCHNAYQHTPVSALAAAPACAQAPVVQAPMPYSQSNYSSGYNGNDTSYKIFGGCENTGVQSNYLGGYSEERPMVFALRSDPTVFVCEYSDRLEYFKRTRQGMVFIKSDKR